MVGIDLGDEIRNDPDVMTIFDETVCLIAVSGQHFKESIRNLRVFFLW